MTDEIQVNYSRTVRAHAKIQGINQAGIHFWRYDSLNVIAVSCVNKKNGLLTSGLELQIPIEDLDQVIDALNKLR